jgi:fructoselysine-6-P-deglycase FrlB-like protein
VAFGTGVFAGIKWDISRFAEFRAEADALNAKIKAENDKLAADLEALRRQLDEEESQQANADQDFVKVINTPSANQCRVPVEPLNILIVEASK